MGRQRTDPSYPSSDATPSAASARGRKRLRMEIGRSLHPHSRPASAARSARPPAASSRSASPGGSPRLSAVPAPGRFKRPRGVAPGPPPAARPTGKVSTRRRAPGEGEARTHTAVPSATGATRAHSLPSRPLGAGCPDGRTDGRPRARRGLPREPGADLPLPGAHPFAAMTSLLSTPSPREELMTTPFLQATEALSPEAEASTALIAVVITVVFLTLLSVVVLIFFYLYKNKGSYVTYEPAEGEPSTILQMESDSAKGRDKEEYFI
ncbi:small cell adhesion glycoprotein [Mustela lutreola]|nr:small cell adhesion glycoprotein [Mustela lutreola]